MRKHSGFTLLEIMVALMIFATAAVALTQSLSQSASSTSALEERQFADMVAHNLLVDIVWQGLDSDNSGETALAGYDFSWQRETSDTPHPDMRKVDITVRLAQSQDVLTTRSAFLRK